MRALLLLLCVLAVHAQRSDGSNLETFPSIVDDLTSTASFPSSGVFNPSQTTAPGPAVSPSSYLPTASPSLGATTTARTNSSSSASKPRTTLVSASHGLWNASETLPANESVVTSTVDGSVTTITVTNTAAASSTGGSNAAGRGRGRIAGAAVEAAVVAVMASVAAVLS
ncbi:hypothetical protein JCM8097_004141 [Rhodosporidiobolus ruineniae]